MKKLLLLSSLVLFLSACTVERNTDDVGETQTEVVSDETREDSIVSSKITTTFNPKATKLRELTEEDHEMFEVIMTRLKEKGHEQLDRNIVYDIATEYGEDEEEFYKNWREIVNSKFHGNGGNTDLVILPEDLSQLANEVIEKNISGNTVQTIIGEPKQEIESIGSFDYTVKVDGKEHNVAFALEYNEDYSKAELIELSVDKEEIKLN